MSSTNRSMVREAFDLYQTPSWLVDALVPVIRTRIAGQARPSIWDPCAGPGRIARVLRHRLPAVTMRSSDIQPFHGNLFTGDFLEHEASTLPLVDCVVMNPPFLNALPVIRKACTVVKPGGSVFALQRINFLGSRDRHSWLSANTPSVFVSSRRPSFHEHGRSDSIEYCWFEFTLEPHDAKLVYLDTNHCAQCATPYSNVCRTCGYAFCRQDLEQHDCADYLFGTELWPVRAEPEIEECRRRRAAR